VNQFLLIERMKVQNANAAAGFTWGFPAITHFLGFTHNLHRRLQSRSELCELSLDGCIVIAHQHMPHTFKVGSRSKFTQYKTAQYLPLKFKKGILEAPSVIEEAKMNMTVSLLIPVVGYTGGIEEELLQFIRDCCQVQRLAGGTILEIEQIELMKNFDESKLKSLRFRLLPGFALQDRSAYLEKHFADLKQMDSNVELLDAWFDFVALKQVARPACQLIDKHLALLSKDSESAINDSWVAHREEPFRVGSIPEVVLKYFDENIDNLDKALQNQWQNYLSPTEKTDASWEYLKKPEGGFLVPIMTGYKAITELFAAGEIDGARDAETDVRFVEAVHSIGEWQSVHRLKTLELWSSSVWKYHYDEEGWYLCRQGIGA